MQIVREDGRSEQVECETRSYLQHDLLHYAAEAVAHLEEGFWGNLAKGRTLAQMNDRTGKAMEGEGPQMLAIERIVGTLSGAIKGVSAEAIVGRFRDAAASSGFAIPAWLTVDFVLAVQERMRRLLGRWKATPYGDSMSLPWPP